MVQQFRFCVYNQKKKQKNKKTQNQITPQIQKDMCTSMFKAVLFTTAKIWKQPKCPLTDKWIEKMWCIYTMNRFSHKEERDLAI